MKIINKNELFETIMQIIYKTQIYKNMKIINKYLFEAELFVRMGNRD